MYHRYPIYAEADLTVYSGNVRKETMVTNVLSAVVELAEKGQGK